MTIQAESKECHSAIQERMSFQTFLARLSLLKMKMIRRLNWRGLFFERDKTVALVVAGYTRSGTTFLGDLIAAISGARMVHEPLNNRVVPSLDNLRYRDSKRHILADASTRKEIRNVLGPDFKGNKATNHGGRLFYNRRVLKLVRANFYLDVLAQMLPNTSFCFIVRHPAACVFSRLALGWDVPDLSNCIEDIWDCLTSEQKHLFENPRSIHEAMTVTWCLDNIKGLRNRTHEAFSFVYFENLVMDPYSVVRRLLESCGLSPTYADTLPRQLSILNLSRAKNADPIGRWKRTLDDAIQNNIMRVVKVFELDALYDNETNKPAAESPDLAVTGIM